MTFSQQDQRQKRFRHALVLRATAGVIGLALTLSACSSSGSADSSPDATITVYTDQHADLVKALTQAYTKDTGIKFNVQNDATVGQIQAEGKASKADVFLSEDPAPVAQLGSEGLLVPIEKSTLDSIRPGLSSGAGLWVSYAARARVLYYNPKLISVDALPKTLADLTEPQYNGKFAWAPSGAFVATTQYLIATQGEAKTTAFLQGIKNNGVNEQKNGNVRDTVEAGKHAMGLSNHYYWWVLAAQKGGPDNLTSKIYHFPGVDPGNLILSSGAGVLKAGQHQAEAQKFVHWLTAADGGQKIIATAGADVAEAQYPVAPGMSSSISGSLSSIQSPSYDMDIFAKTDQAETLLKQLGMSSG